MPNSKHLTHGISNLVSLITKTKLGLSVIQLAKEAGATEENERQWIGVLMITQNEVAMRIFIKSEAKGRMVIIKHYTRIVN
jgi:hypothetical protein